MSLRSGRLVKQQGCICDWTPNDTLRFKGLGIVLIVLHNFLHLVRDLPRENEFWFSHAYARAFWQTLASSPEESLRVLFSFWGHFGVQIFIFLSAFGLTRKFIVRPQGWGAFMASRYRKIYPMFAAAAGLWLLKIAVFSGPTAAAERLFSKDVLYVLLSVSNIVPGQALRPVGPWWFMSFIFQFYAVFPLVYRVAQKTGPKGLLVLAGAGWLLVSAVNESLRVHHDVNLYYTFVGHLPELCLGMYLAQYRKPVVYPAAIVAVAAIVFLLGNVYPGWWTLNHISALILLIALDAGIRRLNTPRLHRVLLFYGAISLPLFLVNAWLRHPLIDMARQEPRWAVVMVYTLLFVLLATGVAATIHAGGRYVKTRIEQSRHSEI